MVKKGCKSNIIITGLLPRDTSKSKRNKLLKVNIYPSHFCKNENMLFMGQGEGWILHVNVLDNSRYYDDHIHLVEPGNAKFVLNISNTINNFNDLNHNLQSKCQSNFQQNHHLTFISKPLPTTSPPKPLPRIASPPKPLPPISPPKPLPTISFSKLLPTTSPHKPLPTTSFPRLLPATSLHKPLPAPPRTPPTTSASKPLSPTSSSIL